VSFRNSRTVRLILNKFYIGGRPSRLFYALYSVVSHDRVTIDEVWIGNWIY
jgi:hypothetical protein